MLILIVLLILGIICVVCSIFAKERNNKILSIVGAILFLLVTTLGIIIADIEFKNTPTALDVYQGKTTLKYTVVDSVITDSTVVFRKENL